MLKDLLLKRRICLVSCEIFIIVSYGDAELNIGGSIVKVPTRTIFPEVVFSEVAFFASIFTF